MIDVDNYGVCSTGEVDAQPALQRLIDEVNCGVVLRFRREGVYSLGRTLRFGVGVSEVIAIGATFVWDGDMHDNAIELNGDVDRWQGGKIVGSVYGLALVERASWATGMLLKGQELVLGGLSIKGFPIGLSLENCSRCHLSDVVVSGVLNANDPEWRPSQSARHQEVARNHAGIRINGGSDIAIDGLRVSGLGQGVLMGQIGVPTPTHVSIRNFHARGMYDHALYLSGDHVTVESGFVASSWFGAGVQVRGSHNVVRDVRVTGSRLGVSLTGDNAPGSDGYNGDYSSVEDCRIDNCTHGGIYVGLQDGNACRRFIVRRNGVVKSGQDGHKPFVVYGGEGHRIEDNWAHQCKAIEDFFLGTQTPTSPRCKGFVVRNNDGSGTCRQIDDLDLGVNRGIWKVQE